MNELAWFDIPLLPAWANALLLAGAAFVALLLLKRLLALWARRFTARTDTRLDDFVVDAVQSAHPLVLIAVSLWIGVSVFLPETAVERWTSRAGLLALLVQAGAWANLVIRRLAEHRRAEAVASGRAADATAWTALAFLARVVVWALLGLVALDNLGVDVTALVAGLGIGGIAIGLAVQNVLGDLFASLAIVLDRPFSIGDFVVVDTMAGTVEHVGLKTTRVRALSGEQIVIANADLLKSRIHNYKSLEKRRVVLTFGVTYDTDPDQLARVPGIVREIVEAQEGTTFDRAHLFRLGDSSMDFEVVYLLASPDYNRHMDVQQAVLLELVRRLAAIEVSFAFPTRTLHIHDGGRADEAPTRARAGA